MTQRVCVRARFARWNSKTEWHKLLCGFCIFRVSRHTDTHHSRLMLGAQLRRPTDIWIFVDLFHFCFIFFFSLFLFTVTGGGEWSGWKSHARAFCNVCVCVCDNFLAASILTRATIRSSLCVFADRANTWISSSSSPPHLLSNIPWLCTYVRTNVCRTCVRSLVAIAMSLVAVSAVGMVSLSSMRARTLYVPQHAI